MESAAKPLTPSNLVLSTDIHQAYCADESGCLRQLASWYTFNTDEKNSTRKLSERFIEQSRLHPKKSSFFQQLFKEYSLATDEGVALMCLAEALLRIPDAETARLFLEDKFNQGHSHHPVNKPSSLWTNASAWGLMVSGKIFNCPPEQQDSLLNKLLRKIGAPLVHKVIQKAMSAISDDFVFASQLSRALEKTNQAKGISFNFGLLGESALTHDEADTYLKNYYAAIDQLFDHQQSQILHPQHQLTPNQTPGGAIGSVSLSVKLSALSPRFESLQTRALKQLSDKLSGLLHYARQRHIAIMIDAEECSRLEPTLNIFAALISNNLNEEKKTDCSYLGLAVQAYQKRALPVLKWLKQLSISHNLRLPIRLVKGAYWESEIKYAQQYGLRDYPIFTQKTQTDFSYLSCAQFILQHPQQFYGYFATHNAHTLAAIITKAETFNQSEFCLQRLHGMGQSIYQIIAKDYPHIPQSVYAPIGAPSALLPYLLRRLIENGANNSFLNLFNQTQVSASALSQDPQDLLSTVPDQQHFLPKPCNLFQPERQQMSMVNLHNAQDADNLYKQIHPLIHLQHVGSDQDQTIRNPANTRQVLGSRSILSAKAIAEAIDAAYQFFPKWNHSSAEFRAKCLNKLGDLIEQHSAILATLLINESGKTIHSALNEIREASDYCRYYAAQCRQHFSHPVRFPGPTGEINQMYYEGRGVIICISPWNFPLSILIGQITAALAAGNCVIAKPASHGELVARQAAGLIKAAGFPTGSCYFTPCSARVFATIALTDNKIAGVCFTGSIDSAQQIQRELALREGPLTFLSAETGGQNVMIADSTALCDQVVVDAMTSAFDSAGQRCSALRVLCLQAEIAPKVIEQLRGRMALLRVGDPLDWQTDVGPVINEAAQKKIQAHINRLSEKNLVLGSTPINPALKSQGYFVSPTLIEIDHINILKHEIFGPVLHILRFEKNELQKLIEQINGSGFGLTLGIHTRIDGRASQIAQKVRCGNIYINRNMVGAVVGSQPFGGMGLSGSGHKSGGPDTLLHLCHRKSISNNTAVIGGNTDLLTIKPTRNLEQ